MKRKLLALLIVVASLGFAFIIQSKRLEEKALNEKGHEPVTSTAETAVLTPVSRAEKKTSPAPVTQKPKTTSPTPTPPAKTSPPPTKPRVITVESGNLYYKPSTIRLKVNEPVKFVIKNKGEHTFTVNELGINVSLNGNATGSVTTTPKKRGTFPIYCAIAGHKEAGMVGKIIIE